MLISGIHTSVGAGAMSEEVFVTEELGLHTKVIRGIHAMEFKGSTVRVQCYDRHNSPQGTEHRINGDFLFHCEELLFMMAQVRDFIEKNDLPFLLREMAAQLGKRGH